MRKKPAPTPPPPAVAAAPADAAPSIDPPALLSPRALDKWRQLVADLRDRKSWSLKDRHALFILADSLATYEEAVERIAREGSIVASPRGEAVKHPSVTVQNQAGGRCAKLLAPVGRTPAGRLAIKETDQKEDPDDDIGMD